MLVEYELNKPSKGKFRSTFTVSTKIRSFHHHDYSSISDAGMVETREDLSLENKEAWRTGAPKDRDPV